MSHHQAVRSVQGSHLKTGLPPGFNKLANSIKEDLEKDFPFYGIFWGTLSIFTQLIHATLVNHSVLFRETIQSSKLLSEGMMENNVKLQIKAILSYLESNRGEFL